MSLSQDTIQTIKATVPVLAEHGTTITKVFYQKMFNNHPELLNIFNKTNQAKGEQPEALANMVYLAAKHIDELEVLMEDVVLVAHKHRGLDVKPEHYPIVGKHLLLAIKEVLGDAATDEIMTAWEKAYGVIAQVFIDVEAEMYKEAEEQVGGWEGFKDFIVVDKVKESNVITSFYLKPADGKVLPAYEVGQYLSVRVSPSEEAFKQIRHYTLSSKPNEEHFRISVKREADMTPNGVVSTYLHDHVEVNDTIEASAPAGSFVLEEDENPIAFISGGVGITPMVSMLQQLTADQTKRAVSFVHSARSEAVHAFHNEVKSLSEKIGATYLYGYTNPENPEGEQNFNGFVEKDTLEKVIKENSTYYIVGPTPFMEHVAASLLELGVEEEQLRFELFGPKQDIVKQAVIA